MITICPSRLWGDPPGGKGAFGGVAVPIGFAVERRPGALAGAESRRTRVEESTLTNLGTNKWPEGILREGRSWKDSERRIVQDRRRPANGSQAEQREGWRGKEKRREKSKKKHPKRLISRGAAFIKGRYCRGEKPGSFFFPGGNWKESGRGSRVPRRPSSALGELLQTNSHGSNGESLRMVEGRRRRGWEKGRVGEADRRIKMDGRADARRVLGR